MRCQKNLLFAVYILNAALIPFMWVLLNDKYLSVFDDSDRKYSFPILLAGDTNDTLTKSKSKSKSICSFENPLCDNIENALCRYLFPYQILYTVHHKTGHSLGVRIFKKLSNWCGVNVAAVKYSKYYLKTINSFNIVDFIAAADADEMNESNKNIVIFHFIRSPLNTVFSGYEFHKKGLENWLLHKLKTVGFATLSQTNKSIQTNDPNNVKFLAETFNTNDDDLINLKNYLETHPYQRTKMCFNARNVIDINMTFNYSLQYALKNKLNIKRWYNLIDKSGYGVFWEFVRYYNCEWHIIYVMQKIYKKYSKRFLNYVPFVLDSFMENKKGFNNNINVLLNALNLIDNEENNNILQANGIYNVNISKSRQDLIYALTKQDLTRLYKSNITIPRDRHITTGTYDKTQLKLKLFSIDPQVCQTLKNLTLLMHLPWQYNDC